jgi:phosphomannomutase
MFTVKQYGLDFGIAITASHNPALYNGVKVFTSGGRDADERVTGELETYIAALKNKQPKLLPCDEAKAQGLVVEINPLNDYIDSILSMIDTESIKKRRLKVVLDPMYGVSQTSLRTILLTARCEVDVIHERHDALFGGRLPAPNVKTLNGLSQFVAENHCDLGIATDGDADRIGVIDESGAYLHPNKLLVLLYYYLLKYRGWKGPAVRNNSTTHLLDRVAQGFGEVCYEVPVGFKHISSKMDQTGAVIGGESSGGLSVRGHIKGKDGIYAASLLIEMMSVTKKSLSELYREITDRFGEVFQADDEVILDQRLKQTLKERLFIDKLLPRFLYPVETVSYLDGCKVYFKNGGWVVVRFSGTEPLLRLGAEMQTESEAQELVKTFRDFLSA